MLEKKHITCSLLLMMLLFSCSSGELSRGEAEEIIAKHYGFPLVEYDTYDVIYDNNEKLERAGVIDIVKYKKSLGNSYYEKKRYVTTEFGEKYVIKKRSNPFGDNSSKVATSILDLDEITGIKSNQEIKEAQVQITLKRVEVTPWANGMKPKYKEGDLLKSSVSFQKYDDGWRITSPTSLFKTVPASTIPHLNPKNKLNLSDGEIPKMKFITKSKNVDGASQLFLYLKVKGKELEVVEWKEDNEIQNKKEGGCLVSASESGDMYYINYCATVENKKVLINMISEGGMGGPSQELLKTFD